MVAPKMTLQQAMENADKQDRRRQQQIKNQMVRMDNMKLIIQNLAAQVRAGEVSLVLRDNGTAAQVRTVEKIIDDAVKQVNSNG